MIKPSPIASVSNKPKLPSAPIPAAQPKITRENLREKWADLERVLDRKQLSVTDLAWIRSGADRLPEEIEGSDIFQTSAKLEEMNRAVRAFEITSKFVEEKLRRTHALIVKLPLRSEELALFGQRLDGAEQILGNDDFRTANEILTDIQNELRDLKIETN